MKNLLRSLVVASALGPVAFVALTTAQGLSHSPSADRGTPGRFAAVDSASLAAALREAYAYTSLTRQPSIVVLGPGNYDLTSQFTEPMVNGSGVSIEGVPGATNLYMSTQDKGSPWQAMIFRGWAPGNEGMFSIRGINLYCTDRSARPRINALYGLRLEEIRGNVMEISDVQVENCGSSTLGGEDIAIGGPGDRDPVGLYMQNVSTNYSESLYTGPVGGAGPTPPANGFEFLGGTADSRLVDLVARNGTQCGIKVDSGGGSTAGVGGLYFVRPHAFGFAWTNKAAYFQRYSFCDSDSGGVDHWIDAYADSPLFSGFLLDTPAAGVDIENPFFYWAGPLSAYKQSNMMVIGRSATKVSVSYPICYQRPYNSATPAYTNQSGVPPVIDGGFGCGLPQPTSCFSSASPAACAASSSGAVTVAAGRTSEVVESKSVTANSQIQLTFDSSLGARLRVRCNPKPVQPTVSARTPGSSFTITVPTAPRTDPACISYTIVN